MKEPHLDAGKSAYGEQFRFYDENLAMLNWYARRIARTCREKSHRSVLSLGIGHQAVPRAILDELAPNLARYAIVEGSQEILEAFRSEVPLPARTELVHSLFEDYQPAEKFDAIEMGFVLEHVQDPDALLRRYSGFVNPGGSIFIGVPNARSLHRLVGHAAGLLEDLYQLSTDDLQLGHRRYFDFESLSRLVLNAGLKTVSREGILLKPLTSGQLKSLSLPPAVMEAFLEVGVAYPEICNAIFIEATP
jgi:SAM-dependent methyltransferase